MRNAHIALLALSFGLVACETTAEPDPFASDVFWVEFTEVGEPCAPREITDNFNDADAPIDSTNTTIETSESIPGRYVSVALGEENTAFVNVDGDVLLGTVKANGSVEATFVNEDLLTERREAETYLHTRVDDEIVEQTITLVPNNNEQNPRFTGTFTRRDYFLLELSETDEWDPEIVGTGATQIPETNDFLEWTVQAQGGVINQEFRDDCPENECTLRVFEDCTREFDVAGVRIEGATVDAFDVLQEFDQPPGVE